MKKSTYLSNRFVTTLLFLACFGLTSSAFAQTEYLPGKYNVDPAHTRVSFVVPHFVIAEVEGRFNDVTGEFTLAKSFKKSTFSAVVPVDSIDTAVKKRDEHLKSKDFFEVTKYPEMKLVSKSISGKPEDFKMVVALTIKDVTKDVTFEGKYMGSVTDSWGNQRTALQATATINRKDFNINYDDKISIGAAVGDEVTIRLWTQGVKVEKEKKETKKKK